MREICAHTFRCAPLGGNVNLAFGVCPDLHYSHARRTAHIMSQPMDTRSKAGEELIGMHAAVQDGGCAVRRGGEQTSGRRSPHGRHQLRR
jgi:hypothetical protein